MSRWWALAVAALALLWAASGVMMVDTGEVAIIYRFGAIARTVGSGLRLRAPWPLERDERINLTEVRRVEPESRRLLTGDYNLVQMQLVVQYTVRDPVAFTLSVNDPETVISSQVMGATSNVAASMEVDVLLTSGRALLEQRVLEAAQASLDALALGVRLMAVDVRELGPPPAVVDSFNDVSSARGDRETLSLGAEAYASKVIPDKRGQAARMKAEARGRASQILARARGEVARFHSLRAASQTQAAVTGATGSAKETALAEEAVRVDLRARTLERIAPLLDVVVVPAGTEIVDPLSLTESR